MNIRKYRQGEEQILWKLFFNTIRTVNARDYSEAQVAAWAPEHYGEDKWVTRMAGIQPFVCEVDGEIIGYAGIVEPGYVDHFYVHHLWQGKGVGTALMNHLERIAKEMEYREMTSDVSITARPFFESKGFEVVEAQEAVRDSVRLPNFKMRKPITS